MNELIARVAALFVEPSGAADAAVARDPRVRRSTHDRRAFASASIVVLGDARAARAGGAVAAALARAGRAPCALLCVWRGGRSGAMLPPLPAAAAAAAKLRARGLHARASGRVVSVALPAEEAEAVAAAARAVAAVGGHRDVPVVLAWCAARGDALDFGSHDVALVVTAAGADPLLASLAAGGIEAEHPGLRVARAELGAGGRCSPAPRAAARAVLEALR